MKRYPHDPTRRHGNRGTLYKSLSRLIVDRPYPGDADTAFNEVSNFTTKLLTGIHELSNAQDTLKDEAGKLSTELQELTKTLQPKINLLAANQNNNNNTKNNSSDNNNNYKNCQNCNKNKPGTSEVGALSKAQKLQRDFKVSSILFYSNRVRKKLKKNPIFS